ncbi:MAG TPA: helix-turn-helix domain-containing protein, partial [Candidatus Nanoarchaeia archaeon]|nr:helix-turn-helix domain-containing protein [Candidatus Nanoarchaeia archaeon]
MPVSINQALSAFGLSEKEQRIYLAALELGSATAGRITEKADINRSTVYDLLRMLIEKGICSTVIKGGKKFFEIVPPRGLVAMIE